MSWSEWSSGFGELLIAGVIYYAQENRAATFLANVQSSDFLQERRKLYEEYVTAAPASASLKTRAEAFGKKLNADTNLRSICDLHWSNIDRLQYALRWSLFHRHLLSDWFPQVLISLWVMTGPQVRKRQTLRLRDAHEYGLKAVRDSVSAVVSKQKKPGGIGPIFIYGRASDPSVEISEQMIKAMEQDLDAPFN